MEPFKNLYNPTSLDIIATDFKSVYPAFNKKQFLSFIFNEQWNQYELKERMWHITKGLNQQLPLNFDDSSSILLAFIDHVKLSGRKESSIEYMFLPDYIEKYGLDHFKTAVKAFEKITLFTSCEFAVRPFILKYPKKMMQQMVLWSTHKNHHIRRLATEGCRPRLPWAMALPSLKIDPTPILALIDNLKTDSSEYVRRSVANNLNDIAKDNPEVTILIANKWLGISTETDKLVKHACRTLLKQGNKEVMSLFGLKNPKDIILTQFNIGTPKVLIGNYLEFGFQLQNKSKSDIILRLEYGLYYKKANGSLSKKVFKISEKNYKALSTTTLFRKQSFKIITTRKFHKGTHKLAIIINGIEYPNPLSFELI